MTCIKRRWCFRNFEKNQLRGTKILFYGHGLNFLSPLRCTDSKTTHLIYLLSYFFGSIPLKVPYKLPLWAFWDWRPAEIPKLHFKCSKGMQSSPVAFKWESPPSEHLSRCLDLVHTQTLYHAAQIRAGYHTIPRILKLNGLWIFLTFKCERPNHLLGPFWKPQDRKCACKIFYFQIFFLWERFFSLITPYFLIFQNVL